MFRFQQLTGFPHQLGIWEIVGKGWTFVKFVQSGWESTKDVSVRKMTNEIIWTFCKNKNGNVGNFLSEKFWEACSFGWD